MTIPGSGVSPSYLYKESGTTSGLQTTGANGYDALVATTITAANSTYSFGNLPGGVTYYVEEAVPSGYLQTGGGPERFGRQHVLHPLPRSAAKLTRAITSERLLIAHLRCPPTSCFKLTPPQLLHFHDRQRPARQYPARGDRHRDVHRDHGQRATDPGQLYRSGPAFDASTANQQMIFDQATGTYSSGVHTLTVQIPNCDYQIDFICGPAINVLGPANYGPDSSNIFYSAQGRLVNARQQRDAGLLHAGRQSRRFWHDCLLVQQRRGKSHRPVERRRIHRQRHILG